MSYAAKRLGFFLFFDAVLSFISFYLAYLLRFNFEVPEPFFAGLWIYFAVLCALKIAAFGVFSVYRVPWRFFSLDGLQRLALAHILAYSLFFALFLAVTRFFGSDLPPFAKSIVFIDGALSILLIGALRVTKRLFLEQKTPKKTAIAIAIVSANENGVRLLRSLNRDRYAARFFVDSDLAKRAQLIHGLEAVNFDDLQKLSVKYGVRSAIIALDERSPPLKEIYDRLSEAGIKNVQIAKFGEQSVDLQRLKIEDLLARNPKDLDKEAIAAFIKGKKVLITGAGGSIGSELSRQAARYGANDLILVDSSEYNLYSIGEEIESARLEMINVADSEAIDELFERTKPQIVLHAAAYKHVPLVEANPKAAVINNVIGTKNCIDAAIKHNAEIFALISTDKAVRPTNVMGATKRVCELYLQNVTSGGTRLAAVRFGNVLGSSGSVIPRFRRLIEENKPLTVTHPEITRYFMLIGEACELVLQAASQSSGGEIFVLDMGAPVKIADMAEKMLALADKQGLGIVYTGLRAGEKLYEELLIDESDKTTKYPSIFVGKPTVVDFATLIERIDRLTRSQSAEEIIAALKAIAPEFNRALPR
ncbi:MAG: polysaccharide biosynthesis protein [Helicobacteraceae bacterium]|jgi:UDP-N-acetyl-D-glucosamine 4,6-dehydratase|nr:polysaccharide biosynthesis protein [Helicobacteraceae bacterium]